MLKNIYFITKFDNNTILLYTNRPDFDIALTFSQSNIV